MKLDRLVVARGAAAACFLAVPATIANGILAAQDEPSGAWSLVTLLVLVVGFFVGGFSAGHERPDEGRRHGLAAALVALVPVEALAVLNRLDRGAGVSAFSVVITAFLAAGAGASGGNLGARRKITRTTRRSAP